jgi:hypothetical protein
MAVLRRGHRGVLYDTITKGFENGNYPVGVAVAHPGPL